MNVTPVDKTLLFHGRKSFFSGVQSCKNILIRARTFVSDEESGG